MTNQTKPNSSPSIQMAKIGDGQPNIPPPPLARPPSAPKPPPPPPPPPPKK